MHIWTILAVLAVGCLLLTYVEGKSSLC